MPNCVDPVGNKHEKITILLSVFGPAIYLRRQLESISAQTHTQWNLIWRDDTPSQYGHCHSAISEFQANHPTRVMRAAIQPAGHLGTCASFLCLLAQTPKDTRYVAFSDQDDVWLPAKLERAGIALSRVPEGVPALYCSRQQVVDQDLKPISLSALPARLPGFRNAIVQNIAAGCTIVLNRPAWEAVLRILAPASSLHDWWSYIVVTAIGGKVLYDATPSILYRQHAHNSVGAEMSTFRRALRAVDRGPHRFLTLLGDHLEALAPHSQEFPSENAELVEQLRARSGEDLWRRLRALADIPVYRQRLAEDLLLRFWFLFPPPPPAKAHEARGD